MGRTVTVDPSVQAHAEAAVQARTGAEVGALVGRVAASRDLIIQAIRATERDGEEPVFVTAGTSGGGAGKKGGKAGKAQTGGGAGLQLDEDWVVEHAAMVERILPGGLDIVGFYVLCPAAAFAGAAGALAALAAAACKELSAARGLPSLLLLHMDSVTGALALREAGPGQLRPAELRVAGVADQMATLQSRFELDLSLPVADGKQELQVAFQAAADAAAARLCGALGLIGGRLAGPEVPLADLAAGGSAASDSICGPIPVELLLQPASSLALCTAGGGKAGSRLAQGCAEGSAVGHVTMAGALDCRACVHRREPAAAAVDALRADIQRSLQARMDALLDAAEQQQEAAAAEHEAQQRAGGRDAPAAAAPQHPLFVPAGAAGSKPLAAPLPRRAFVAVAAARGVPYCDYLFEGEGTHAVLGRLQLLLPWPELAGAAVDCLETSAAPAAQADGAQAARGGGSHAGSSSRGAAALPCTAVTAASLAAAALALAVGYLSLGSV